MGAQVRDHDTDSPLMATARLGQLLFWLGPKRAFQPHADWHSLISPAGRLANPGQARPSRAIKMLSSGQAVQPTHVSWLAKKRSSIDTHRTAVTVAEEKCNTLPKADFRQGFHLLFIPPTPSHRTSYAVSKHCLRLGVRNPTTERALPQGFETWLIIYVCTAIVERVSGYLGYLASVLGR